MDPCSGHHDFSVELFFKKKPNPSRFWEGRKKRARKKIDRGSLSRDELNGLFRSFDFYGGNGKFLNSWHFLEIACSNIFWRRKLRATHFCDNSFSKVKDLFVPLVVDLCGFNNNFFSLNELRSISFFKKNVDNITIIVKKNKKK